MDSSLELSEYNTNTTVAMKYPLLERVIRLTVVFVVSVAIILSNLFNFVFLKTAKHISPTTKLFLTNLTAADFCMGLIACLPAVTPAFTGTWPYGVIWCHISRVVLGSCSAVSMWSIAVIG